MKANKVHFTILLFLVSVFGGHVAWAQITLAPGGGGGYTPVSSYQGVTILNHHVLQMDVYGEQLNVKNWSISVRVKRPIRNSQGKVLDPSKVNLRLNHISGSGDVPTIAQVGAVTGKIPLSMNEFAIIPNSHYSIKTGKNSDSFKQIRFSFDIIVEGGSYLEELKTYNEYPMEMEFIFRSAKINPEPTSRQLLFQIYPTDQPPLSPIYGIQIHGEARNGTLEFNTMADYSNGASKTYLNGLSVIANTPYVVQVNTSTVNFEDGQKRFPVEFVNLAIKDPVNPAVGGSVFLSHSMKEAFRSLNMNTQARYFDLTYSMKLIEDQFLRIKPGNNYQTTLTYTLIPQ